MSSDEYDIDPQRAALPKKKLKKVSESPTADILKKEDSKKKRKSKKISTKEMVNQALVDLNSGNGTTLNAIKKYIEDKYEVDVKKRSKFIKKYLKLCVELGIIVEVKKEDAAGSSKLAPGQEETEKKKNPAKKPEETSKTEKLKKKKPAKKPEVASKAEKPKGKKPAKKPEETSKTEKPKGKKPPKKPEVTSKTEIPAKKTEKTSKTEKPKTKPVKEVESNENKAAKKAKKVEMLNSKEVDKKDSDVKKKASGKKEKAVKTEMAKVMQTPAKQTGTRMRRKSIGSIIKPPKMKPTAKA